MYSLFTENDKAILSLVNEISDYHQLRLSDSAKNNWFEDLRGYEAYDVRKKWLSWRMNSANEAKRPRPVSLIVGLNAPVKEEKPKEKLDNCVTIWFEAFAELINFKQNYWPCRYDCSLPAISATAGCIYHEMYNNEGGRLDKFIKSYKEKIINAWHYPLTDKPPIPKIPMRNNDAFKTAAKGHGSDENENTHHRYYRKNDAA